jgi:hypothetical protein
MTREQRREFFEFVGLLAVVGSLLFLALEIRQNTAVVSGQSINEIYDAIREIDLISFADPELTRITMTTVDDVDDLTESDRQQYEMYLILMIEVWERAITRENEGLIDSDTVSGWHVYYDEFVARHVTPEIWARIRWNWKDPELHERVGRALTGVVASTD